MAGGSGGLLATRRFLPLFVVQATGGLNDNLYKNAAVILLVFQASPGAPGGGGTGGAPGGGGAGLAAVAGGVFILPYALLSPLAGQMADRFDKARLIRLNKVSELLLMLAAAVALLHGGTMGLLAVLLGLGVQAALFGPLKYGILPQHLAPAELLGGNALIEAATFAAILVGTILGGLLIGLPAGPGMVGALGVALSAAGLVAAWCIPAAPGSAGVRVEPNPARAVRTVLRAARGQPAVWRAVLALSWFWALGATYLALFPVLVRDVFRGDTHVVTLLLAGFALGIGAGAMLGTRLARHRPPGRLVRPAGLALSLCTLAFAGLCTAPGAGTWQSPQAMLGSLPGLLAWVALLGAAMAGGVFSLPLNTAIQQGAGAGDRARMVAANNVMNAVFMVVGAGVIAGLSALSVPAAAVLAGAALLNAGVALGFGRGG